jgi:hypothetical protein
MPFTPAPEEGIDDRAAAALQHQRSLMLQAVKYAGQVRADEPVPLLLGDLDGLLDGLLDFRVVEGDVEPPEGLDGLSQRRLDALAAGDVAAQCQRPAAFLLDGVGDLASLILGEIGKGDGGAASSERQCGRAPDPSRCASHESDLAGKALSFVRADRRGLGG